MRPGDLLIFMDKLNDVRRAVCGFPHIWGGFVSRTPHTGSADSGCFEGKIWTIIRIFNY
jgi:hypothetical protein